MIGRLIARILQLAIAMTPENSDSCLPAIEKITMRELKLWLRDWSAQQPPAPLVERGALSNILKFSQGGKPRLVLECICKLCGVNWYKWSETWLKY